MSVSLFACVLIHRWHEMQRLVLGFPRGRRLFMVDFFRLEAMDSSLPFFIRAQENIEV